MTERKPSVLWFQDGIKLQSPNQEWRNIDVLTEELIRLVGHPGFKHEIIFPENCQLVFPVTRDHTIVDLSGFTMQSVVENWPFLPVVEKFRISRVRNVSSQRLDGCGFTVSMTPKEIKGLSSSVNLENPVLIDDVAWSGRTALESIRLLGLNPTKTMLSVLVINVGNFGERKPGAADLLKSKGVRVSGGIEVKTPEEDGFHLADFFQNRTIADKEVFGVIIHIQRLRELMQSSDEEGRKNLEAEIKKLLGEHREALFPNAKSTEQMRQQQTNGTLIAQGGIPKNSFFDTNPPNWLMPSFSKRVQSEMLLTNIDQIVDILKRFHDIFNSRRFL